MRKPLHAILIAGSVADADALGDRLAAAFDLERERVGSIRDLAGLLDRGPWDVIVGDFRDPARETAEAAGLLRERGLDVPLVVVSDSVGEEVVVRALRSGARGYLRRSDLGRLPAVVERELGDARTRARLRQVERDAHQTAERFATLVNSDRDLVFLFDARLDLVELNEAALRAVGKPKTEILGTNMAWFAAFTGKPGVIDECREVLRTGRPLYKTDVIAHDDFRESHWAVQAFKVGDGLGVRAREVTEEVRVREGRERAEAELHERSRMLDAFFEHSITPLVLLDPRFNFIRVNEAYARACGRPVADFVGHNHFELYPNAENQAIFERVVRDKRPFQVLAKPFSFPDHPEWGTTYWDWTLTPMLDASGAVEFLVFSLEDVTTQVRAQEERRRAGEENAALQAQLVQAQKMEAIGRLAGGVAHDFNNMMTAVTGHARRLLRQMGEDDPNRRAIEEILKGGERAALLTRQLLAFSRKQIFRVEPLDLNAVVGDMAPMLRRLLGEEIELVVKLAPELGAVRADRSQIEQVVVNLAVNARDAMPEAGRLVVATANARLEDREELARLDLPVGDYVRLSVEDSGHGMTADVQAHVFEPFFTTKPPGEGTGLGLSTAFGIVKQSGGGISFSSQVGRGTSFVIYLPRTQEPVAVPRGTAIPAAETNGGELILLVEDEAIVRKLISLELEDAGYRVLQAENPGHALSVAEKHREHIHLLLSDVVLPGMSGPRLFEALSPLRPEIKVLYISGHTERHIVQHGVLNPGTPFLEKPFTPEALLRKLREVLAAR